MFLIWGYIIIMHRKILWNKRCILFLLLLALSAAAAMQAGALTQTDIIYAMDDAYVNNTGAGVNFDSHGLRTGKTGSDFESFFRFDLSAPSGYYVTQASLWLYADIATNSKAYEIQNLSDTTWTETNITWNNKPSYSSIQSQNTISTAGWFSWQITNTYSLQFDEGLSYAAYALTAVTPATADILLEDSENSLSTGNVPYLNLTMMIPEVFLLSPGDGSSTYESTVTFQYNTTDAGNILNCSLILDGAVNMTNTSAPTNASSTFALYGIFPGAHTWTVRCYDSGRYVYQIEPAEQDLTILARVDWYSPSSATDLDIGYVLIGSVDPSGSRQIYSNNTNQNIDISCASGDCSVITTNWSSKDMSNAAVEVVYFNCSTSVAGSFQADFELTSDQDGTADTLSVNCSVLAPDLRVNSTNITFSDYSPTEGETVTITSGVYNDGTADATDAVVRFYEGHYSTGTQIGSDHTVSISAGDSTTVQESWTAKIGEYDIYVVLDPPVDTNGSIAEGNESNNFAYSTDGVSMWTIFVGNVSGALALQTAQNQTLLRWNVTDTTNSLVYVTDTDSSPDFNSFTALSRDTTGSYIADDFIELDNAINTSVFYDSINSTFTSGGNPITTETFTVFGVAIDDVPIVNTTNTSSFVTGILWDSSDDSNNNNQFDSTSEEDIIFVTRVNKTKQGQYGVYDYEIRLPARLKDYKAPDVQTVTFYAEIK